MGFEETFRTVATASARFAGFSANALIFGMAPVLLLVLRPAFSRAGAGWGAGRSRVARRLEGMFQACLVASGLATLIALVLQAALVGGATGGEVGMGALEAVVGTPFGRWHLVRLPLLIALAVLLGRSIDRWSLAGTGDDVPSPGPTWWGGWLVLSLGLLATSTMSGHATVARPFWVSVINDVIHLASGAVWLTGIIIFAVILPDAWRGKDQSERLSLLTPAVVRFSIVAAVSVAILAVTGALNTFLHVGKLGDLVATSYGIVIALKIGAFMGVLALGGINHFYVRRRFERAAREPALPTARLFRRTIAVEFALALLILGLTGILTGLARTREAGGTPGPAAVTRSR